MALSQLATTFVLSLLALQSTAIPSYIHHGIVTNTKQGLVQGTRLNEYVNAFLGVPYAQPPLGPLRFLPPQSLNNTSYADNGTLNATRSGSSCYQFAYRTATGNFTEPTTEESKDCLTLNILIPSKAWASGRKSLPVFLWSYGGAFGEGSASVPAYDPRGFVEQIGDVIVVTLNYRMNIFGFPNAPALGPHGQNLGIRDQRAALEWVRDNIAAFGGDPARIIAGGQSSGADSWHSMMYAYSDDRIIQGLAMESGTVQVIGSAEANVDGEFLRVAGSVGCGDVKGEKIVQCMRGIGAEKLKKAVSNSTVNMFGTPAGGTPMVDNVTLFTMEEYVERGAAGRFARVPTLMGSNDNEDDAVLNWSRTKGINQTLSDIITISLFTCNLALEAGYMPVWPIVSPYPWLRAYHGAEIPMLMGSYNQSETSNTPLRIEVEASRKLQNMFAAFIRDPENGLEKDMGWPKFNLNTTSLVKLFTNNTLDVDFVDPGTYDEICKNPPLWSWLDVIAPPPE